MSLDLLALTAAGLGIVAVGTHRAIHHRGVGLTPLGAFLAVWVLAITAYLWNPLQFIPLQTSTWETIGLGIGGVVLGYAVVTVGAGRPPPQPETSPEQTQDDARALLRVWQGCALAGGALFAAFFLGLWTRYGLANLGLVLFRLRSDLGAGSVPTGFYFFYFAEPLVPLSLLCALHFRSHRHRYLAMAAGATLALLLTSGRTNASKAILWAAFALLLHAGHRRLSPRLLASAAAGAAALILVIFVALGGLIGKTYQNSPVYARFGAASPIPSGLTLPYLYVASPLPTLDQVIASGGSEATRGSTLRPVYQVGALFDARVRVPAKIQEFRATPYPFNVSTFLGPLHEDYGAAGVVIGALLFGALLAAVCQYWHARRRFGPLLLCALACVMAVTSSTDAVFNNLSYLFQAGLVITADRFLSQPVATAPPRLSRRW